LLILFLRKLDGKVSENTSAQVSFDTKLDKNVLCHSAIRNDPSFAARREIAATSNLPQIHPGIPQNDLNGNGNETHLHVAFNAPIERHGQLNGWSHIGHSHLPLPSGVMVNLA
jgi:hypothetical protein